MCGLCATHTKIKMHAGFWKENLKERNHMEDTGRDNIKMNL
jgi:hypothetical protein